MSQKDRDTFSYSGIYVSNSYWKMICRALLKEEPPFETAACRALWLCFARWRVSFSAPTGKRNTLPRGRLVFFCHLTFLRLVLLVEPLGERAEPTFELPHSFLPNLTGLHLPIELVLDRFEEDTQGRDRFHRFRLLPELQLFRHISRRFLQYVLLFLPRRHVLVCCGQLFFSFLFQLAPTGKNRFILLPFAASHRSFVRDLRFQLFEGAGETTSFFFDAPPFVLPLLHPLSERRNIRLQRFHHLRRAVVALLLFVELPNKPLRFFRDIGLFECVLLLFRLRYGGAIERCG